MTMCFPSSNGSPRFTLYPHCDLKELSIGKGPSNPHKVRTCVSLNTCILVFVLFSDLKLISLSQFSMLQVVICSLVLQELCNKLDEFHCFMCFNLICKQWSSLKGGRTIHQRHTWCLLVVAKHIKSGTFKRGKTKI